MIIYTKIKIKHAYYVHQMLLSFKKSAICNFFFKSTPENCVRCEEAFVGYNSTFFLTLSHVPCYYSGLSTGIVTDNLYCQLRTFSQKIKTYQFCNPMKLTFCDLLQKISGCFYLYCLSLILWKVFIKGEKIMILWTSQQPRSSSRKK